MISSLTITNLLSFGDAGVPIELRRLNVLIGPNGCGKSNLIEVLGLLRATPNDLTEPIRTGGGIDEWIWKGPVNSPVTDDAKPVATIEVVVDREGRKPALRHSITFGDFGMRLGIIDERIENAARAPGTPKPYFYFGYEATGPVINTKTGKERRLQRDQIDPTQSILSQRKDPDLYPELAALTEHYSAMRFFRDWSFGRHAAPRLPQPPDQRNDFLMENAANLGLVLNRLRKDPATWDRLMDAVRRFYPDAREVITYIEGGAFQVFLQERTWSLAAARLSDGTLRFLCLLAVLLDRNPPRVSGAAPKPTLLCIEEPELGLHPDVLHIVADLMREASERVQIVVTTHSTAFVDAFSQDPEAVVVCEKVDGMTRLERLDHGALDAWLKRYGLGQLWTRGDIGGNRF